MSSSILLQRLHKNWECRIIALFFCGFGVWLLLAYVISATQPAISFVLALLWILFGSLTLGNLYGIYVTVKALYDFRINPCIVLPLQQPTEMRTLTGVLTFLIIVTPCTLLAIHLNCAEQSWRCMFMDKSAIATGLMVVWFGAMIVAFWAFLGFMIIAMFINYCQIGFCQIDFCQSEYDSEESRPIALASNADDVEMNAHNEHS